MPAIDFPASPTLSQEYTFEGRTWLWNGTGWEVKAFVASVGATGATGPGGPNILAAGSATGPSLYFTGDDNTGIYSPGADTLAVSAGGTQSVRFDSSGLVFNKTYTEKVFVITGTTPGIAPINGAIQTWVLTGTSVPVVGPWDNGQSITLAIDDGAGYTILWTSLGVTWKTDAGFAPTLNATGITFITLWKVGDIIYGARVGNA